MTRRPDGALENDVLSRFIGGLPSRQAKAIGALLQKTAEKGKR